MYKNIDEFLEKYEPQKPKYFYGKFFRFLLNLVARTKKVKYIYKFDKKEVRHKQVCILSDHSSRDNFYFTLAGYPFAQPNCMVGYQNLYDKTLFRMFIKCGVIPKYLYIPDMKATKDVIRLQRQGCSFLIFPEGIQSTIGSTHPMNPATMKLVKKLNMDIILCKSRGAYLCKPRYSSKFRRGPMEFEYSILFKKEELETLTVEQMYERFIKEFKYNDFIWNKEKQYQYKGKNYPTTNIECILYKCPCCGKEFTIKSEDDCIVCDSCMTRVRVDNCYNMHPLDGAKLPFERLDEWYYYQRKLVKEEIKNDNLKLENEVLLKVLKTDKLYKKKHNDRVAGEGILTLTKDKLCFKGTKDNEEFNLDIDISLLPSAPFTINEGMELYYGKDYYTFEFKDNKHLGIKYMLYIEELHNLTDPAWKQVSDDVYGG